MKFHALGFLAAATLAGMIGFACNSEPEFRALCSSDEECVELNGRPDWVCDRERGRCACRTDDACADQEHCEPLGGGDGYCHPNRLCEWNDDCERGEFCDIASSICRRSGCSLDLQCGQGEVCDLFTSTCIPGCRSDGDCGYRDVCICDGADGPEGCVCDAETEEGRRSCQRGTCMAETCTKDSHCEWGQICVDDPDPENPLKICINDPRGPFCDICPIEPGNAYSNCEGIANYCLTDQTGGPPFCGVSCADGQSCPNGFRCSDVLVTTSASCGSDAACVPHESFAPDCETDDDCTDPEGRCVEGKCAGFCMVREGGVLGWCSCVADEECPNQTCSGGTCTVSGHRCQNDSDCRDKIFCHVGQAGIGYCKIGENCAPTEGVACSEVREIKRR